jgi:hypothetical protein
LQEDNLIALNLQLLPVKDRDGLHQQLLLLLPPKRQGNCLSKLMSLLNNLAVT